MPSHLLQRVTFLSTAFSAALLFALAAQPALAQDDRNPPTPDQTSARDDRNPPPPSANDDRSNPQPQQAPVGGPPQRPFPGPPRLPPTSIPATQPTALPQPSQPAQQQAPIAATAVPAETSKGSARRARVTYIDGLLNVRADNSSLNQILHDISRRTGMTITGGVADQRVFGDYGPASPSTVLATLLDGTGTNMLLRETGEATPIELVLTPRTGGATPPNPNAASYDDTADDEAPRSAPQPQNQQPATPMGFSGQAQAPIPTATAQPAVSTQPTTGPQPVAQPLNNPLGNPTNTSPTAATLPTANSVPIDTVNTPSTVVAPAQGIVDAPNPPPPGSTTDTTTTPAAATPDSIYQQLLKLQQQKAAQPAAPTTPAPPQ